MTKQERQTRRDKCKAYLVRVGSIPEAKKLAKKENFTQNASVWIEALAEAIGEGKI